MSVHGKERIIENLARFAMGLNEVDAEALDNVADKVVRDAKDGCPVGTPVTTGKKGYVGGSLRKSIRKEKVSRPSKNVRRISVRAGGYVTNPNTGRIVDYEVYVHEGTSKMPGRPFLKLAYEKNEDELLRETAKLARRRLF